MRGGYDGETTIEFVIERVKDLNTDQYRLIENDEDMERSEDLVLEIKGSSYFYPGEYSRLPEDCYPDDYDTEIISIYWNGKPFPWKLTKQEEDLALEKINSAVKNGTWEDY